MHMCSSQRENRRLVYAPLANLTFVCVFSESFVDLFTLYDLSMVCQLKPLRCTARSCLLFLEDRQTGTKGHVYIAGENTTYSGVHQAG